MDVTVVGKEVIDLPKDETPSSGDYFLAQDENGGSKAIDYANLEDSIVGSVASREFDFSTRGKSTLIDAIEDIDGSIGEIPEIKQSVSSVAGNVAEEFSVSKAYAVGDYVLRDGQLYCFTTAHPAGAWNASHVQAATVADAVSDLKGDLGEITELVGYEYIPVELGELRDATTESYGITVDQNSDGTVHVYGTNTYTGNFVVSLKNTSNSNLVVSLTGGKTYRLTGCQNGGNANSFGLQLRSVSNTSEIYVDYGKGIEFPVSQNTDYNIRVYIAKDATVDVVFAPEVDIVEQVSGDTGLSAIDLVTRRNLNLLSDNIPDTTQTYTFSDGSVSQVTHSKNGNAVRTDAFTYGESTITEVRTLNTGESLTIVTNLTTLETSVTYSAA